MAFLDGEADPETTLHLQQCEHCHDRAKTLEREQKLLASRLYRASCPSTDELGEFHLRMLPSDQMLIISQHVRECPLCTREINQLKEFLGDLVPVTEGNLLQQTKRLVAQLVSGGGAGKLAGALRGPDEGPLTFETEGTVIVLDIQPASEGNVNIFGQVAADDQDLWTGSTITLNQADGSKTTDSLNDLGAFQFEKVSAGSIQITILSPQGIEIQIPNFDV
ncbi:MAG: hypothetical protein PVJ21_19175 [Anaerolineales bacterium]|jgi:hypothetical protein